MDSLLNIIQTSKIAREWLNGGLVPLNVSLVIVIGLFLFDTYREHGRGWTGEAGVQTACALWWIFFFDGIRAIVAWALLRVETGEQPLFDLHNFMSPDIINGTLTVAGLGGVIASLRCIHLFTPPKWKHWYWVGSALATAAWLAYTHQ